MRLYATDQDFGSLRLILQGPEMRKVSEEPFDLVSTCPRITETLVLKYRKALFLKNLRSINLFFNQILIWNCFLPSHTR